MKILDFINLLQILKVTIMTTCQLIILKDLMYLTILGNNYLNFKMKILHKSVLY